MRRADREIKDERIINEIITRARFCHIALHDGTYPYLVTVNFGFRDNCLYFHAAAEGKKIDLIRRNPNVCFQLISVAKLSTGSDPCNDWTTKYKSITGYGNAVIVTGREEKIAGMNTLMAHYSTRESFAYDEHSLAETAVIKIEISSMTAKGN
jgi:nitroimidazol reductase NimA-like FMN-containing flavoprotein (pyridoxamine 5'-phosphate oxidase superfamily)